MKKLQTYKVTPSLPQELQALQTLANNFYWTWDADFQHLFRRLDRSLWEECDRNPAYLLGNIDQKRLSNRRQDEGYLSHLSRSRETLEKYLSKPTWFDKINSNHKAFTIAYFSMEYGLASALPIYSGGLGILAADHLKSSSDLGLPLVAVGLLYQEGYFHQYLSSDGWQQETYPESDFYNLPIQLVEKENTPVIISVEFPDREVFAQIWKARIGRIELYLLDTNIARNNDKDKNITDRLYGGDKELRIQQEILLGIGGMRALHALDISPTVCHMNEGHSAFLALERIRLIMSEYNLTFNEAKEAIRGGTVFTSHTPVQAGIDEFDPNLVEHYLASYYQSFNISKKEFLELGGVHLPQTEGKFNMAIFAINTTGQYNGVSRLHGEIARAMWNYLWPELPENEVPITHVTNGVHIQTWISEDLADLFHHYLGPKWFNQPLESQVWTRIQQIPDEELWRAHERQREQLVAFARKNLQKQLENSGASSNEVELAREVLDPKALTIGFGRRFAQYKRAYLLFKDLKRLEKLLNNPEHPVQLVFSGKAHPHDNVGKGIIKDIVNTIRHTDLRNKIVFLEDYDMRIASHMISGVDVWLNTPRRPREASGTSGMKAGANGVLNLSILDGWWDEAYNNNVGWAIGRGEVYQDHEEQDDIEAEALYDLLENSVIPIFYDRGRSDLPRRWIEMMKNSIQKVCPQYNTHRMVRDYFEQFYIQAEERWERLSDNQFQATKDLIAWKEKIQKNWNKIKVTSVTVEDREIKVGNSLQVRSKITIDGLKTDDISVEIYYGHLNAQGEIQNGKSLEMSPAETREKTIDYHAHVPCETTGQHGLLVRIRPKHPELTNPFEMGLVHWYNEQNS
ncbi:alpha-glucan family phosphorylase [candidate division KSB1 bacterium]|nr:alpha-glucan family phosphorylase [candidate division KSB1 bacterium]